MPRYQFCYALVFAIALGAAVSSRSAEENAVDSDDSLLIRFVPVRERARELVVVELVRPAQYGERYLALEQAVFKNDWRPALFIGSDVYNPGKCTVTLLLAGYDVDCWLERGRGDVYVRQVQVKTVEEAIAFVKEFSKQRVIPIPRPPKKVDPVRTILV